MKRGAPAPVRPFRWDLVEPAQLGRLLEGTTPPSLWFLDELTRCAAKVLARSADGDLQFVGRSADSVCDLLSGALAHTSWAERLHRLPFSMRADGTLDPRTGRQLRSNLAAAGCSPAALVGARRPRVFVDLVLYGGTFEALYRKLNEWAAADGVSPRALRNRLRFVGLTLRTHTSPNTWRWQQNAEWTGELPSGAIQNVSLESSVWRYLGNDQLKLTESFHRGRWASAQAPKHDAFTRQGLREAVALVEQGRSAELRRTIVRLLGREPTWREPWLRRLAGELRAAPPRDVPPGRR
ncbi:MAG: hypothetical protein Q8L48_30975 [Archangium sp.]|nr:hypothetical protein [Archangium sp.]